MENDAQLAIMDALFKLDKKASVDALQQALIITDYLVRKKAFDAAERYKSCMERF